MNSRLQALFNYRDWPLAAKLAGSVLLLLVPGSLIVNAIILSVLQDNITTQIGNNLHTLANAQAEAAARDLTNAKDQLADLSRETDVINQVLAANNAYPAAGEAARAELARLESIYEAALPGDPLLRARQDTDNAAGRALRSFVNNKPPFSQMIITDHLGGLVAVTTSPSAFGQASETWWPAAYNNGNGAIYISKPFYDQAVNLYAVTIAVPIIRPNSVEVIGVLHANYRLVNLLNLMAQTQAGATGHALLLTQDGLRLDTTAGDNISIPAVEWQRVLNNPSGNFFQGSFQGRQSLVAAAPIISDNNLMQVDALHWYVVVDQDLNEGLAAQRSIVGIGALIALAGLIVVGAFTINFARQLTRPIVALTNVAQEAQAGHLEVAAPVLARDEVGILSDAFNAMIGEIRAFTSSLENKVSERTAQLAAINEIASVIAGSLDINEVMAKTVNLIRDRLGFYHVSIFLLDAKGENAVVRESTGEVGQILKSRPHTLAVGSQSIIGYVTANRKPRIALDTQADAGHFKNPLLPNTRSEMALPLIVGDSLFGALDVQSSEPNAFRDEDVAVLQSMANQVAVAINNARLFQESQARLTEVSLLNRQYLGRAWDEFAAKHAESVNLQLEGGLVAPAPQPDNGPENLSISAPTLSGDGRTIAIPITLRDEIIGEFTLSSPEGVERWDLEDMALVEAVVAQVALAVENARLLEETQNALSEARRLARRERVLSEITAKITSGADVKRVLQIAADELRRATGSSRAVVKLTPPAEAAIREDA